MERSTVQSCLAAPAPRTRQSVFAPSQRRSYKLLFQSRDQSQRFHEMLAFLRAADCDPEFVPQSVFVEPAHINALRHERSIKRLGTLPQAPFGNGREEKIRLRG